MLGRQLREDLLQLGEAVFLLLREHEPPIHAHLELTAAAARERRLDAATLLDLGRQTGGPGQVVSGPAVADLDLHARPPR